MVEKNGSERTAKASPALLPPDGQISSFLGQVRNETNVAPLLEAGVAERGPQGWSLRWGSTAKAHLPHVFDLASVTKPHFATLVGSLVERGKLDWDQALQEVLPELEGLHAGRQTVEALLSHRSGLVPHVELFRDSWAGATIKRSEVMARAARAVSPGPSATPRYSDLGYILLGYGVERTLRQDLDEALFELVLQPWQLRSGSARSLRKRRPEDFPSRVAPTEIQPPRGGVLRGVVHDDNAWMLSGTALSGHAGLFGDVRDVLGFGMRVLDSLAGRRSIAELNSVTPLIAERPGGTLRMGFDGVSGEGSMAGSAASQDTFGHLGFTGTSLWCDPRRDKAVVLLSNRVYPTRDNPRIRLVRPKIHDFLWAY